MEGRAVEVDGEPVVFSVHEPELTALPSDFDLRGSPTPVEILGGCSKSFAAILEDPASRAHVDDYSEDELRDLWRRRLAKQAGELEG